MKTAKQLIQDVSEALHIQAADALSRGMGLARQSARLEQLGDLCGDDEAQGVIDVLVEEGMLRVVDGEAVLLEAAARIDLDVSWEKESRAITSKGGSS